MIIIVIFVFITIVKKLGPINTNVSYPENLNIQIKKINLLNL